MLEVEEVQGQTLGLKDAKDIVERICATGSHNKIEAIKWLRQALPGILNSSKQKVVSIDAPSSATSELSLRQEIDELQGQLARARVMNRLLSETIGQISDEASR